MADWHSDTPGCATPQRPHRLLFERCPDLLCSISTDGYFQLLNPAWEGAVGYSLEELRAHPACSFIHPEDSPLPLSTHGSRADGQSSTIESRFRCGDGSFRWFEWLISAPNAADGLLHAAVRDVTGRKQVDQLKSEFVSVVSHELRTPLASIRGSLGLLGGGVADLDDAKKRELIRIAQNNTDRLVRLINDLLDLDRIESGYFELRISPIELHPIVDATVKSLADLARQAGVTLEQQVEDNLVVLGDHDRLVQVLVNLVGNAIKFSPRGSRVHITGAQTGTKVRVAVRDHGPGIPLEHQRRIFDKFEQLDASDSRAKGGTGLGLAIAWALVERHGGTIGLKSKPDNGSEFFIHLPCAKLAHGIASVDASCYRILLVEDHPDVAQAVHAMLEHEGYEICAANSVSTAKEVLTEKHVDAVVLDIELPDGRGSQLGEWMHRHELHRDVPVVVISGRVSASDTFEDPLLIAWLAKPFSRVDLVKAVRRALHKPGTPPTVLLADADETTRSLLSAQFREMGARCLEAACGRDALRHALQSPPDLLVLDADISDMDGFELVEQLRRTKTRSTPLIVYTGRDLYPQDRRRLRLGMSRYLTKSKHLTAELVSAAHETLQDLLPTPKLG